MAHNPDMTIQDRRNIQKELEALNDGSWLKIASENSFEYNQVYFWFLVEDANKARNSYDLISSLIQLKIRMFPNTEFILSFDKLENDFDIIIESLHGSDLRLGRIPDIFGLKPSKFKRQEFTVFDRDF